jgi:hypothetical protein
MVLTSWKLRSDVCHEKIKWMYIFDGNPLITNGADISRIDGFVKIAKICTKSNAKSRRLGKMSIFLQDRLK